MAEREQMTVEDLKRKRDELRERLEAIERDYRQGLDADSGERAQQLENAEVLEGIAKSARMELEQIEEALLKKMKSK